MKCNAPMLSVIGKRNASFQIGVTTMTKPEVEMTMPWVAEVVEVMHGLQMTLTTTAAITETALEEIRVGDENSVATSNRGRLSASGVSDGS